MHAFIVFIMIMIMIIIKTFHGDTFGGVLLTLTWFHVGDRYIERKPRGTLNHSDDLIYKTDYRLFAFHIFLVDVNTHTQTNTPEMLTLYQRT